MNSSMTRDQFRSKLNEYRDTCAVLMTGMPQATAHESSAAQSRGKQLEAELTASPWTEARDGSIIHKRHSLRFIEAASGAARSSFAMAMNLFRDKAARRERG